MNNEDYLKFSLSVSPESYLFSSDTSIGGKTLQKFKRGQFVIDNSLDLHGFNLEQAEDILEDFFQDCLAQRSRYLLVIHGKGSRAILKNYVNRYLEDHPKVLAFCSAKPKDGGVGAVYVLLKKQQNKGDPDDEE